MLFVKMKNRYTIPKDLILAYVKGRNFDKNIDQNRNNSSRIEIVFRSFVSWIEKKCDNKENKIEKKFYSCSSFYVFFVVYTIFGTTKNS